ncbi:cytochrome P450 77A4-like [Wolffia australiana]
MYLSIYPRISLSFSISLTPAFHVHCPRPPPQVRHGPIFSMKMGQRTLIIVISSELIHEALVQRGHLYASRPADSPTRLLFCVGKCTVNSAPYGPLWRALRRNFVAEIVSPAKVKQFAWIRDWAMANHLARLRLEMGASGSIWFGAKVSEQLVQQIEAVMKEVMLASTLKLPDFLPALSPLSFTTSANASSRSSRRWSKTGAPSWTATASRASTPARRPWSVRSANESCVHQL